MCEMTVKRTLVPLERQMLNVSNQKPHTSTASTVLLYSFSHLYSSSLCSPEGSGWLQSFFLLPTVYPCHSCILLSQSIPKSQVLFFLSCFTSTYMHLCSTILHLFLKRDTNIFFYVLLLHLPYLLTPFPPIGKLCETFPNPDLILCLGSHTPYRVYPSFFVITGAVNTRNKLLSCTIVVSCTLMYWDYLKRQEAQ